MAYCCSDTAGCYIIVWLCCQISQFIFSFFLLPSEQRCQLFRIYFIYCTYYVRRTYKVRVCLSFSFLHIVCSTACIYIYIYIIIYTEAARSVCSSSDWLLFICLAACAKPERLMCVLKKETVDISATRAISRRKTFR